MATTFSCGNNACVPTSTKPRLRWNFNEGWFFRLNIDLASERVDARLAGVSFDVQIERHPDTRPAAL